MNFPKRFFALLFAVLFVLSALAPVFSALSHAADSTSFDPRPVLIEAQAPGGGVPVGTVVAWPLNALPDEKDSKGNPKWLECNGQTINATVYPALRALYGARLPDFRGLFLRGHGAQAHLQENGSTFGITSTLHQSGALGQVQGDGLRNLTGNFSRVLRYDSGDIASGIFNRLGFTTGSAASGPSVYYADGVGFDASRVVPIANENRPANTAVRYIVKALP